MASVSSKPQGKWRLRTTLKRRLEFRPIEDADIRYAWAAYKTGSLAQMVGPFAETGMQADEFKTVFETAVTSTFDGAWTMFAETGRGFMPVGLVFGIWSPLSPYMIVAGVCWFSWASKRNVIESIVNFFSGIRREIKMMLYALPEHKIAYEVCCMHGIMRRIGTSCIVFPGKSAAVYETRE